MIDAAALSRSPALHARELSPHEVPVLQTVFDVCARQVWRVSRFLRSTALHGRQLAAPRYAARQAWTRSGGARRVRLGVVEGHARAERCRARQGVADVRLRAAADTDGRIKNLRVRVKPLADGGPADHLARVPRDRPGSGLP